MYYFPPPQIYLCMGGNHNLCCVFFQILSNLHDLHPLQLVAISVTMAQLLVRTVDSAVRISHLPEFLESEKYPGA